jgi:chromosome segregation ATPase
MNKVYIIGPLAGLLVFGAIYWNFMKGYEVRLQQEEAQRVAAQKARIEKELAARRKAIEDAIVAAEKRKVEREAKEKKAAEEKAARDAMLDRRLRAYDDVYKRLRPQLDRLKNDADGIKGEIAQLDLQRKQYVEEETFLRTFVKKAQDNVKTYTDLLDKIAAAEKARAAAEALAKAKKS